MRPIQHSTLNLALLEKVRDKIAAVPKAYDQTQWADSSDDAPCGTVACIAGWAAILSGAMTPEEARTQTGHGVYYTARDALRLTRKEAETLFSGRMSGWPYRYRLVALLWDDSRAAVRYLNRIIRTGKVLR